MGNGLMTKTICVFGYVDRKIIMEIEIKYRNGNSRKEKINYLHFSDGYIYFTVDRSPHQVYQEPVQISLEYVENFDVRNEAKE